MRGRVWHIPLRGPPMLDGPDKIHYNNKWKNNKRLFLNREGCVCGARDRCGAFLGLPPASHQAPRMAD